MDGYTIRADLIERAKEVDAQARQLWAMLEPLRTSRQMESLTNTERAALVAVVMQRYPPEVQLAYVLTIQNTGTDNNRIAIGGLGGLLRRIGGTVKELKRVQAMQAQAWEAIGRRNREG